MRLRESGHLTLLQSLVLTPNQLPKEMALSESQKERFKYASDIHRIRLDAQKYYFLHRFGDVLSPHCGEPTKFDWLAAGKAHNAGARLPQDYSSYGMNAIYLHLHQRKGFEIEEAELLSVSTLWKLMQEDIELQYQADKKASRDTIGLGCEWDQPSSPHRLFSPSGRGNDSDAAIAALHWARHELQLDKYGYELAVSCRITFHGKDFGLTGMEALQYLISVVKPDWPLHKVAQLGHKGIDIVLAKHIEPLTREHPLPDELLDLELFKGTL